MHKILEAISELLKSRANTINKTMDINGWIKSKDRNIFSQALKNHELDVLIRVSKAKGVRSINTFTMM